MAIPAIKPSLNAGELSPSLYGRLDLAKWHSGASVARNFFVSYKGGLLSRGGTAFVGFCKQAASANSIPPRNIEFIFNIFQSYILEFGDQYMRVIANGGYVTESAFVIIGMTQANPCVLDIPNNDYAVNDWIFLGTMNGVPQLTSRTVVVKAVNGNSVTIEDVFGTPINALAYPAYTGGGTSARIYTLATPYAAADLPYLKYTQSADVMSLTCVNQETQTEYPAQELSRLAANSWTIAPPTFASSIGAPTNCAVTGTAYSSGPGPAAYGYVITAIDAVTGDESVCSNIGVVTDVVDISGQFGTNTVTWSAPSAASAPNGVSGYNIYRAAADYTDTGNFAGQLFGYVGSTNGALTWQDANIIPDFTTTPPLHLDPFAVGQILGIGAITQSGTFAQATTTATLVSANGSGGVIQPIITGGVVVAAVVADSGEDYQTGDTVNFTDATNRGTGSAPLTVGPQSGNYPGVVAYFQQRRGYAASLNNPDQYEFSQPGSYTNFDSANPPIDSDSITGTPWAEQINGIQWMLPMPGGLVDFTGKTTWQLSGTSGAGSPITPSQQDATAQEGIGCSPTLPPLRIRYNILFGDALNGTINEVNYNFFFNIYAGQDITVLSSHLFQPYQLTQWAFAFNPYRVVWGVRSDGKAISLTYVQEQEVRGFARHDTNGQFVSVAIASEPPVHAPYFIVKRFVLGENQWMYMQERMDNRLWQNVEQVVAIDSALTYPQPAPNANLTASAAQGEGGVVLNAIILGGEDYTAPSGVITDLAGTGSGAEVTGFTLTAGVISGLTIVPGENYQQPVLTITDSTGQGAKISLTVDNSVTFTADANVFDGVNTGVVGQVVRMGGGIGTVSKYVSPTEIIAQVFPQAAIAETVPDDPNNMPLPATSGNWTITAPVSTVYGLEHLNGMTVNALCDGTPVTGLVVANGSVALPSAASSIVIGLPFIAQAQSMHADLGGEIIQGKRKRIQGVTVRVANSRGIKVGQDQPIAAQQPNQIEIPWDQAPNQMTPWDTPPKTLAGPGNALPLFSGDKYFSIAGDYHTPNGQPSPGMVAVEQDLPLPCEICAFIPQIELGDMPDA